MSDSSRRSAASTTSLSVLPVSLARDLAACSSSSEIDTVVRMMTTTPHHPHHTWTTQRIAHPDRASWPPGAIMARMDADEIRRIYLQFMVERGHVVIPRAPLIPHNDPTTLFTGSGMQPLLPYLLGQDHPDGHRLTDSQTCLRVQEIDEVGDNRHTTFSRCSAIGAWGTISRLSNSPSSGNS